MRKLFVAVDLPAVPQRSAGGYLLEREFLVSATEADGGIRSFRWLGQEFVMKNATKKPAR